MSFDYAVSAGILYSNTGTKYDEGIQTDENGYKETLKLKTNLHYLQVPIIFNGYIAKGFAAKIGVQAGYLLDARCTSENTFYVNENGNMEHRSLNISENAKRTFKKFDVSIPVGLSYEIGNAILDLRYNWGLLNVGKYTDQKNKSIVLTVGYGIDL